jgi:hypothetical protein
MLIYLQYTENTKNLSYFCLLVLTCSVVDELPKSLLVGPLREYPSPFALQSSILYTQLSPSRLEQTAKQWQMKKMDKRIPYLSVFRIRIHLIRIRIQHFRLNTPIRIRIQS